MTSTALKTHSRREELLARCQQERCELVAATATLQSAFPRTRRMAHWLRAVSRMLRAVSASMRAH